MTSRGNQSISPPAQISQQRHGNVLPSGTPPPQQQHFFQGPQPALQQGGYEYLASQQPLLPYQAYGSAVNDVRAQPGNGARGGPPQQTMHQGGAAYYPQPSQNMRPQQGQVNNQQYYISAGQMQSNIRQRPHHPNQSQPMFYIPQSFTGNNVVVAQNLYPPRAPLNTYYAPVPQSTYPLYIPNGAGAAWQGPRMPQAGPQAARPRERKIIEIKDPNTGKDLTEELLNNPHPEHTEPEEEPAPNQSSQDVGKLFTRLVADRLNKPSEDTSSPGAVEGHVGSIPPQAPVVPSSQQYQQPPPPSTQQPPPTMAGATHMMRPGPPNMGPPRMPPPTRMIPPRPGMMQQSQQPQQQQVQPPATPPHPEIHQPQIMNFSMPPPQIPLRQPTPAQVYSTAQQHPMRHPQQPQPVVQQQQLPPQAMRPPNVPVMPNTQSPVQQQPVQPHTQPQQQVQPPAPVAPQQQHPQPTPQPDEAAAVSKPAAPAPEPPTVAPPAQPTQADVVLNPTPEHIPEVVPVTKAPSPPAKEEVCPPPSPSAQKEASQPPEEADKTVEGQDDVPQGASNRGPKDGRRGKKNKRELNTKEIGGSDMDAFIDSQTDNKDVLTQNGGIHPSNGGSAVTSSATTEHQPSFPVKRDPRNPWSIRPPHLVSKPGTDSNSGIKQNLKVLKGKLCKGPMSAKVGNYSNNVDMEEPKDWFDGDINQYSKQAIESTKSNDAIVSVKTEQQNPNGEHTGRSIPPNVSSSDEGESSCTTHSQVSRHVSTHAANGCLRQLSLPDAYQGENKLFEHTTQANGEVARDLVPPMQQPILSSVKVMPKMQAEQGLPVSNETRSTIAGENTSLNATSPNESEASSIEQAEINSSVPDEVEGSDKKSSIRSASCEIGADVATPEESHDKSHGDGPVQVEAEEEDGAESVSDAQERSKENQRQPESIVQVEPKHKLKKKKKKKGRKSPPLPKAKPVPTEEKESETSTSKPPLPPLAAAERRTSVDKATPQQDAKPAEQEAVEESTAPAVPATPAATPASEDNVVEKQPELQETKESSPTLEKEEEVAEVGPEESEKELTPSKEVAVSNDDNKQESVAATADNQNQLKSEGSSQEPGPAKEFPGTPQINIVPSDSVTKDKTEESEAQTPVNDENTPPKEIALKAKPEETPVRAVSPSREEDDEGDPPGQPPLEKTGAPVKKGVNHKLQYDRAYLMELRGCASSQTKPEGLPNLEIILDRPVMRAAGGTSPDFTPTFFQPTTPQRHPPQMGKSASRGRARPGEMQMPQRIIKSVSIQNDVKALHQSEKPWKPTPKQLAAGEIATKVDNLESKALFILNRLTPTNFEPLSAEMIGLKIGDYEQLQQLVKIFFDKVTLETKFVEAYAKLCKKMCTLKVPPPKGIKENQATFRVLLLTKCQTEFESDKTIVFEDPEEKRKKLEAELPEGPDKKDQIETTLYHMKLRRLKFYGNIRFIGELFKLSMLTENIMHDCIFRLLKARDDESLLSLCNLITTVGSILDTEKAKQRMDQYFAQMTKIAEERKSRIKFTLKDSIELRQNNWVPRKETTGPKKIDEVRQDFHQEQQTKQFLQNQPLPPRNEPQPGSRRGSRQRQEEKPSDDGWNTVGSKSLRIDASKMKFTKSVVDENTIQLGPGGGTNKFAMWGRGSGAAQSPQDSPMSRPNNRFSALPSDDDRRFQRSPSRGDSGVASRGLRQGNTAGHGRGKMIGRSSIEGERREALANARSIVGGRSQNSSRDNSWNREDRRSIGPRGSREGENPMGPPRQISLRPSAERMPPPPAPVSAVSSGVKKAASKTEEEMEHSAKTIMDEYLNIHDLKEAKLCVMELEGQRYLHTFITASINNVLERADKDRILTGQFFYEIVKDNLLSMDKFIKGLSEVLQFAEDMVIDIPKMWTNLAQLIAPVVVGGSLSWSQLKPTMEPHLTPICSAKLVAEILLIAKGLKGDTEVAKMWQTSGLSWDAFLPADRVSDFIKDKKLEFLEGTTSSSLPLSRPVNQDQIVGDLVKVMKDNRSNSDILAYIKDNVPKEVDEKTFVRLLMTAVIKASLSATMKPNVEMVSSRQEVLQKYIKTPVLELQALFAIQALMHKMEHPGGLIASLFDTLYNDEIISEEAFKQWEVSQEEPEGKGACSLQLTQFFTWLRENEEMETS